MSSFVQRLKEALGDRGYQSYARRSVQTAILYEANRCLSDQLPSMRPFQRKLAFYDQAKALLEATGFSPQQQTEIMWRTGTSREVLNPDSAWKRAKLVEKELEKIREKVKPLCMDGKTHNEIVDEYIQQQYVSEMWLCLVSSCCLDCEHVSPFLSAPGSTQLFSLVSI
jgi:hypothetical protein